MAKYTTNTSDKSKGKALKLLLLGGIGLHLFYVGRIKAGLIRLMLGILLWVLFITGIAEKEPAMIASGIVFLVLINAIDLVKLALGTFKDNVGNNLRA
jgi:hypothetical protein